ncbi:hypothetical protein ACFWWN_30935, partial [Streptomyces sp. NPDC059082]
MITEYQQRLRARYLAATVMPAPAPWQPVWNRPTSVGGLLGIGFAVHPGTGHDLVMVVSGAGHRGGVGRARGVVSPAPGAARPRAEGYKITSSRA